VVRVHSRPIAVCDRIAERYNQSLRRLRGNEHGAQRDTPAVNRSTFYFFVESILVLNEIPAPDVSNPAPLTGWLLCILTFIDMVGIDPE
jgi:hypothetical protein